ncbi:hypothetical protein DFH07DRAFT_784436 [Mycena maculata]|uniref:Glucose-methanol-choline oxidoreductase N-terminal domain-containing protein n=1 Tax=Mycena maculata TaxID=230809 RepID=A0AAD7HGK2_9AGAR|nr:hypothetical protein DFH07DRAFT_784436 [Mycena maculata]
MVYTRGSAEDFDRYAALTGDPGWSWDRRFLYFLKNEKWTPPADDHDTHNQFDPCTHHVLETTKELPEEFPFNLDFNSSHMLGVGEFLIDETYIVSKLVNPDKTDGDSTFKGVEFLQYGSLFTAKVTKEIILSARSVGTPDILMHSGIGDSKDFAVLIPSVLEWVRTQLTNHSSTAVANQFDSNRRFHNTEPNTLQRGIWRMEPIPHGSLRRARRHPIVGKIKNRV